MISNHFWTISILLVFSLLKLSIAEMNNPPKSLHHSFKTQELKDVSDALQKLENIVSAIKNAYFEQQKQIIEINELFKSERKKLSAWDQHTAPYNTLEVKCADNRLPENCEEVNECQNHIYSIMIPNYHNLQPFPVTCDLKTDDGGWTIIQRRLDGSVNFYRNWTDYVEGFGNQNGEFFIGLEKLHVLTTKGNPQELYIKLEDFEGEERYAKYSTFKVDSNETDYKLTVGNYSGNSGDCFHLHNGHKFSTWDRDNDASMKNCAEKFKGAWWYGACLTSNLNGKYLLGKLSKSMMGKGISWCDFRTLNYSLKFVQMMTRPIKDD